MEAKLNSDQRLSLIIETQREISAAGDELHAAMQLIAERSQAIIGADGAMVNLIDGDMLHTRGVSGTAVGAFDARRPVSGSVARFAIGSGQPILIEDCPHDPRIDQVMRAKVGDQSLICVPLFRGQEVIGTLNVMSRSEEERLTEDDRETLEMISVVLSAAVSRAAEFEARRAQASRDQPFQDPVRRGLDRHSAPGLRRSDRRGQPGARADARRSSPSRSAVRASPSTYSARTRRTFETDARRAACRASASPSSWSSAAGTSRATKCGCCCAQCWSTAPTESQTARSR